MCVYNNAQCNGKFALLLSTLTHCGSTDKHVIIIYTSYIHKFIDIYMYIHIHIYINFFHCLG